MHKVGLGLFGVMIVWAFSPLSYGLRLSQIEFDLTLPGGSTETGSFLVINDEAEETTVNVSLADWFRALDGENRFVEPGTVERSAAAWITVAPTQFFLAPGDSVEVRFTISVPANVAGTFWTALLVEGTPREVQSQAGTTILVRKRFAVKILETPPGTGTLNGQIRDLKITGQNPLTTVIQFENAGLINMPAVKGRVEIRDATGQTIESISIEEFPILPGALRKLTIESSRPLGEFLPPGRYLILAILDFGGESLLGGQLVLEIMPLDIVPLGDAAGTPQDLDEDGWFEDVNGDGVFDASDAVFLGFQLEEPGVQNNARAFDFNNDGVVDFDDVVALRTRFDDLQTEDS